MIPTKTHSLTKKSIENAPLTKEEQTLIHQYETAFKAGISFQQESELMALSANTSKKMTYSDGSHSPKQKNVLVISYKTAQV